MRTVHTLIFIGELRAIPWLVVTGLAGMRDRTVALAAAAVGAETAAFVITRGVCPLTPLSERLDGRVGSVSDISLPDRVARTIPSGRPH